jgi:hypothetical protein
MYRRRPRAAGVRPRPRLGQSPRAQPIAARQQRNVLPALHLGARKKDMVRAQRVMRRQREADRTIDRREFLDRQHIVHIAETRAAVLRGKDDAHQAHRAQLANHRRRELARLVPLHHMGCDLARGEAADLRPQALLLVGQNEGIQTLYCFKLTDHIAPLARAYLRMNDTPRATHCLRTIATSATSRIPSPVVGD